ncbi:MAG: zf-HC2 domain-containing protein [Phycisphaeraceae bacterium]|nr:zf-HC2 domain-containing protein [Phycisphaeraceae bacterium]
MLWSTYRTLVGAERHRAMDIIAPCPDSHDLAAWVDGTLGSAARLRMEEHLVACADCLDLALAARGARRDPEAAAPPRPSRIALAPRAAGSSDPVSGSLHGIRGHARTLKRTGRARGWARRALAAAILVTVGWAGYELGLRAADTGADAAETRSSEFDLLATAAFGAFGATSLADDPLLAALGGEWTALIQAEVRR